MLRVGHPARTGRGSRPRARPSILVALVLALTVGLIVPAIRADAAPPNPSDSKIAAAQRQRRADVAALGKLAGQIAAIEGEIDGMQAAVDAAVNLYNASTVAVQKALVTAAQKNKELTSARAAADRARQDAVLAIRATFMNGTLSSGTALVTARDPNAVLVSFDVRRFISLRQHSAVSDLSRIRVAASNAAATARGAEAEQRRLQADAATQRDAVIAALRGFQTRKTELQQKLVALNRQAAITFGRLNGLRDQRAAYLAWAAEQRRLRLEEQRRLAALARQRAGQGEAATTLGIPPASAGAWGNPMSAGSYTISSCFCARWGTFHYGVDFAAGLGTPIHAIGAGTVVAAGPAQGFGNWVVINHGTGELSVYGHMRILAVSAGEHVSRGQLIAFVGTEGDSTGPHLHLEIRLGGIGGTRIDPQIWLAQRGVYI